ncbi:NAD(P)H-dependent oxidoreductase [Edwardsiella tarda]|uniref:NAD(P)H-dependent oxidoreductase n=1 Tax=Edwardsiella tarda TaxID=636 RepID=UPI00083B32C7|nr:NAD(P)H-dependent oxidoreductase [Edwardsiella tarda]
MDTFLLYDTACPPALRIEVESALAAAGSVVVSVELDIRRIRPCVGCFKCWVKTPGACYITRDGVNELSARFTDMPRIVLLTQVLWGSYSADSKAFIDRCIQHLLPFFSIRHREMHHVPRYRHYPDWVVIGYQARSPEEQETFRQLIQRNAINFFADKATGLCLEGVTFDVESRAHFAQILQEGNNETVGDHQRQPEKNE